MDVKENLPTILSVASCAGVVGTGYAALELGKELERRKKEERNKKTFWVKTGITIGAGVLTIAGILASNKLNKDRIEDAKREAAEAAVALGALTKLFRDYRAKVDPEENKKILSEIAVENADIPTIEKDGFRIVSNPESDLQIWTDPFISMLTDGEFTYYFATEADILWAALQMKDAFHGGCTVCLGLHFYDKLRERGVTIPEIKGENGIYWEYDDDWFDYYGDVYFEFDWYSYENKAGDEVNSIIFSDTNEVIHKNLKELENWCERFREADDQKEFLLESAKERTK